MAQPEKESGSMLLVEEFFNAEDPRFLEYLRSVTNVKALAAFADRWKRDPRPWARERILAYLQLPMDVVGHEPVVKRIFKHAERAHDNELVAAFMVAFDRLVRVERKTRYRYDWKSRQRWEEEVLVAPRNTLPKAITVTYRNPRTGKNIELPVHVPRSGRLFTYRTRHYLRRRAWRYIRHLGFQKPQEYPAAVARGLRQYRDEDLSSGEDVLECWSLMQACFRKHGALQFGARHITPRAGRSLSELTPAPAFTNLWEKSESLSILLSLVTQAWSRFVRVWAMQMIRQKHQHHLADIEIGRMIAFLEQSDPEVQQFGAELLEHSPILSTLAVDVWLQLLTVKNPTAQSAICDLIKKYVSRERLSLQQCVKLACAQATPVARLGFEFLQSYSINTTEDRQIIGRLAETKCQAIGREIAQWALLIVGTKPNYDRDAVLAFLDSLVYEVRDGAWQWLVNGSAGADDASLFSRLLESPFDDIRLRLISELQNRVRLPALSATDLAPIWSSVLLGVHRGGRQKIKATRQLAEAIAARPERASELLPVLRVAVRSLRSTECRAGLASLMQLVERRPELVPRIVEQLPELKL